MYDVSSEINEKKEAVKEDLAVAEAKLASTDTELQLLQQQVTDLNTRAEQIKTSAKGSG